MPIHWFLIPSSPDVRRDADQKPLTWGDDNNTQNQVIFYILPELLLPIEFKIKMRGVRLPKVISTFNVTRARRFRRNWIFAKKKTKEQKPNKLLFKFDLCQIDDTKIL